MQKYHSIVFFFFMFSTTILSASNTTDSTEPTLITRPFLFELERDNKKSLLLGSAHAIKINRFPNYAKEKLSSAKSLVVEVIENFRDMSKENLAKYGFWRASNSDCWIDLLEPHLKTHLEEKLTPKIRRYHPDINVGDLTPLVALMKYDSPDNNEGMDYQLQQMYDPSVVFELESIKDVSKLLEIELDLSRFKEILEADYSAKQNGEIEPSEYYNKLSEYQYVSGALDELKISMQSLFTTDSTITRNNNYLPKIDHYHLNNPSPLIVVGLSHLLGEAGLLNLLQTNRGYSISQLTPDGTFKPIDIVEFK